MLENHNKDSYFVTLFKKDSEQLRQEFGDLESLAGVTLKHFSENEELKSFLGTLKSTSKVVLYTDSAHIKDVDSIGLNPRVSIHAIIEGEEQLQTSLQNIDKLKSILTIPRKREKGFDVAQVVKSLNFDPDKGVAFYLEEGTPIVEHTVATKIDKKNALNALNKYVLDIKTVKSSRTLHYFGDAARLLLDELLLNAVFNANPRYIEADRAIEFELEPSEQITVQWAADEQNLVISVQDPFGKLSKEETIQHIINKVTSPLKEMTSGGKGLRTVYENLNTMLVGLVPGKKTEIVCIIKLSNRISFLKRRTQSIQFYSA